MGWNYLSILNFNGCIVEIQELISNFIPHFIMDVIILCMLGSNVIHVSNRGPSANVCHGVLRKVWKSPKTPRNLKQYVRTTLPSKMCWNPCDRVWKWFGPFPQKNDTVQFQWIQPAQSPYLVAILTCLMFVVSISHVITPNIFKIWRLIYLLKPGDAISEILTNNGLGNSFDGSKPFAKPMMCWCQLDRY